MPRRRWRLKQLFFDLDGTLTHPHEGITRCIQHALSAAGVEPPTPDALRRFVGPPLRDSFAILLSTLDDRRIEEAIAAYRDRFESTGMFENEVCPGMQEVLDRLRATGREMSVVTAKPKVFAQRILDHFGLASFFSGVYGPELSSRSHGKRALIRAALRATGASSGSACMIGDRGEDVTGARANGILAIAVTWGYAMEGELAAAQPDATVRSAAELLDYVERAV